MNKQLFIFLFLLIGLFGLVEATTTLNSPTSNQLIPTYNFSFNATTNSIGTLYNMSLYTNKTGNWSIYNTTNLTYALLNDTTNDTSVYHTDLDRWVNLQTYTNDDMNLSHIIFWFKQGVAGREGYVRFAITYNNGTSTTSPQRTTTSDSYTFYNETSISNADLIDSITLQGGDDGTGGVDVKNISIYELTQTSNHTQIWSNTFPSGSYLWNVFACNSTFFCEFSASNRTFNIDEVLINVLSPSSSNIVSNLTLNATITSNQTLSYCYYNVTRGVSTEISNTALNCSNPTTTFQVSGQATYSLNIFANTTSGVSGSTAYTFNFIYAPVTSGGGGSSSGGGEKKWVMKAIGELGRMEIGMFEGFNRTLEVRFINKGSIARDITLSCVDVDGNLCKYVTFPEKQFSLPAITNVEQSKDFQISLPEGVEKKEYTFNIQGRDGEGSEEIVSVIVDVGTGGFIVLLLNKVLYGLYWLLFIPVFITLIIVLNIYIFKDTPLKALWSFLLSLVLTSMIVLIF